MANGSQVLLEKAISFVLSGTSSTLYFLQYWVVRNSKCFREMMSLETKTVSSASEMEEMVMSQMVTPNPDF